MDEQQFLKDVELVVADNDLSRLRQLTAVAREISPYVLSRDWATVEEDLRGGKRSRFDVVVLGELPPKTGLEVLSSQLLINDSMTDSLVIAGYNGKEPVAQLQAFPILQHKTYFFPCDDSRSIKQLIKLVLHLHVERKQRRRQEDHLVNELAERKIMEARLKYLVSHDELTGLANRRSLEQNIELAIYRAAHFRKQGALLYVDLDRFNVINDVEGYSTGDHLLIDVVKTLQSCLQPSDYLARLGSDEFCIYMEQSTLRGAMLTAEAIRQSIDELVMDTETDTFSVTASIGVALLSASRKLHPNAFIVQAHQACIVAKTKGRNRVHLYNGNDAELLTRNDDVIWFPLIRQALANDRFEIHFQPVVDLQTGEVRHYEALLRMLGSEGELVPPDKFIPVAERTGLITHIDLWVVDQVTDYMAKMPEMRDHLCININLSGAAFNDPSVFRLLQQKLEMNWVDPSRITFEITESAAISNIEHTCEMIGRIRALGCHFAIDDFGTGFSSFHYLKYFQVDYLKIDGQFINNLVNDSTDLVLVKAIVDIAHQLGKKTVAEYVHDANILGLLRDLKVDFVQGYLLGKPQRELLDSSVVDLTQLLPKTTTQNKIQTPVD